jgi:3-hydroxy-9,10-secoandrosta-1,3,5(10)-triene-9,17-dione monooxygenase
MTHLSATGSVMAEELTYDGTLGEISTDAGVLRYHEAGDGPPLLLLHGSGPGVTGRRNFRGILGTFAEHFRCLILEFPGFGVSDDFGGHPMVTAQGAVSTFVEALGLDSVDVIGNSMGGAVADRLREQAAEAERLGRLPDETVKDLKSVGAIRLLQPKQYNGFEVHPREFAETVMTVASLDPASGWICGVVGVHPYQLAYADPRVPEEIWGTDTDTWVASPYAPQGVAKPVAGGYIFNGRWQFSSGTDACEWIFLGAMVGDADGKPLMPPQMLHMILPRKDYQIIEDSWNVFGLRGTGSKDVIVRDAFVPDCRMMNATEVMDGTAQREAGMTDTLYLMPWSTMFPLGITSAVIGIAEGALAAHLDYQRDRVGAAGTAIKDDPYVMYAIGEAAADINAARQELLANVDRIYDIVDAGNEVSFADRAAGRCTQVRSAWRAVMAVDQIFSRSGGNALRMDKPLQRYWRDAHAGLAHAIHVPGTTFHASALSSLGIEPEGPLRAMI